VTLPMNLLKKIVNSIRVSDTWSLVLTSDIYFIMTEILKR
jgi:hypothetical protein